MRDAGAARDGTGCGCVEEVVEVVRCGRVCVGGDDEGEGAGAEGVEGELEEARDGVEAGGTGCALVRDVGFEARGEGEGAEGKGGVGEEEEEVGGACWGDWGRGRGDGGEAGEGEGEAGFEVGDLGVQGRRHCVGVGVGVAHWRCL